MIKEEKSLIKYTSVDENNLKESMDDVLKYLQKRVVHAKYNGVEVVRCDEQWFLNSTAVLPGRTLYEGEKVSEEDPKEITEVTLEEAATNAAKGVEDAWQPSNKAWPSGFQVFFGLEGGEEFDEIVKSICPMLYIDIQEADLGDNQKFLVMKCPGCEEWLRIDERQRRGDECVDHFRGAGSDGCGFHGYTVGAHAGYIVDLGNNLTKKE